ncbi:MAG: glycosyltransferase [Alphaproteobacteria bacterium]
MAALSVIIPLAPDETELQHLLDDLAGLPAGSQIILVASENAKKLDQNIILTDKIIEILYCKSGRAAQMNAGAQIAANPYLWFLHADSKFSDGTIPALLRAINDPPPAGLSYFDLAFLKDGSRLMFMNGFGVYMRCRLFKTPFGDQGFLIKKDIFQQLGGYPEEVTYGEDHVFVWRVRQAGFAVTPIGGVLYTSARKYKKHGWLKITLLHQYLWIKQAWPEWKTLRKGKK